MFMLNILVFYRFVLMYIITFKHEGKVYQRRISRKQGFYVMESKGEEYWFGRDISKTSPTKGWHIINQKTLSPEFLKLLSDELEKLYIENNSKS